MGGTTKQGVDCSGFVCNVYKEIYGISLPRRSQDMAKVCKTIKDKND
jgi:cell wall-associated NlpC family hydrolase